MTRSQALDILGEIDGQILDAEHRAALLKRAAETKDDHNAILDDIEARYPVIMAYLAAH